MPIDELIRALEADGWSVRQVTTSQPYVLEIRRGEEAKRLRVYIWNVTPGGPSGVRPTGEWRIQKMVHEPLTIHGTASTLLLGWNPGRRVFVSWNPRVHQQASYSTSIQVPQEVLDEAATEGLAVHHRSNPTEVVVSFVPESVSAVLTGLETLPIQTEDEEEATLVAEAASIQGPPADLVGAPAERQQTASNVNRWSRDARFRPRVLWAYKHACALCGLQFGLVQAAHIVPVSEADSTDETSNGVALCPTCHAAFDKNLLGLLPDYTVVVNRQKSLALKASGLADGLENWLKNLSAKATVPDEEGLRPNPAYVQRRLELLPAEWMPVHG